MTDAQDKIVQRFRRLVADARKAGLIVAVDGDVIAIRLIPKTEHTGAEDIRELGETVKVDDACGCGSSVNLEMSCGG